ncbi:uncharacterized protein LOC104582944 [Brachypodium distachyon]|uniref:uncharacterized protein LOC104582944 n=1 Tax=Brachypodium distachyon TaxID=15368 RepID=UPI00071D6A02|nr:uncharacterized protein LOC104582944 [Brachypodium distachyon]|eukprot:XP_010232790.2 uncharacterized protein LOC104582944 [Brachypodium distachyon]
MLTVSLVQFLRGCCSFGTWKQFLLAEWIHLGLEDQGMVDRGLVGQVGEALVGGVRLHLAGLGFLVALVLVLGDLGSVALALVPGDLGSVASSGPASTSSAAAACSKIAAVRSSDSQARAARHTPSDSMPAATINKVPG